MRSGPIVIVCAVLFAIACVDRALDPVGLSALGDAGLSQADLSKGIVDLAAPQDLAQPDLASSDLSCAEIITCFDGCFDEVCAQLCFDRGSAGGRSLVVAYFNCLEGACAVVCDAGGPDCDLCIEEAQRNPDDCEERPGCGACFGPALECGQL